MERGYCKKTRTSFPAGSLEKLKIAIHYGADAVFLGSFSSNADNFTIEELKKVV